MKTLEEKAKIVDLKAKRRLAIKQAVKLEKQAAKFRQDSLKFGCELAMKGVHIYKEDHPVYGDMILPLLHKAAGIAGAHAFDILFQTRCPMPNLPDFTSALGAFADENKLTPTMKGCVDLVKASRRVHVDATGAVRLNEVNFPVANDEAVEGMARVIYEQWAHKNGYIPWVPGGNSDMQKEARRLARAVVTRAEPGAACDNSDKS